LKHAYAVNPFAIYAFIIVDNIQMAWNLKLDLPKELPTYWFFWWQIFTILRFFLKIEHFVTFSLVFWKKSQKSPQLPKVWKGAQGVPLPYFEYCQVWLNILMDDCPLGNIIKLKKKTLNQLMQFAKTPKEF
jgi:hypothetical protein